MTSVEAVSRTSQGGAHVVPIAELSGSTVAFGMETRILALRLRRVRYPAACAIRGWVGSA